MSNDLWRQLVKESGLSTQATIRKTSRPWPWYARVWIGGHPVSQVFWTRWGAERWCRRVLRKAADYTERQVTL